MDIWKETKIKKPWRKQTQKEQVHWSGGELTRMIAEL